MKTSIILFASILILISSAWSNVDCSSVDGSLLYKEVGYNRGVAPLPGDVLRDIQINLNGELISHSIYYQDLDPVLGSIQAKFKNHKTIERQQTSYAEFEIYIAKLSLVNSQEDSTSLPTDIYVICQESNFMIP